MAGTVQIDLIAMAAQVSIHITTRHPDALPDAHMRNDMGYPICRRAGYMQQFPELLDRDELFHC